MNQSTSSIDLNKIEYKIKQIDKTQCTYYASQISNNEQYIAYGGSNQILKIYDIKQDKIVRQLVFNTFVMTCLFSSDSSQLFIGLYSGNVYGYDVQKEFKQIFRKQIHKGIISKMIIIKSQYLITCSYDWAIRKTDIRSKKQIFKLIGHTSSIRTIDYNQIDDIIISGSNDKSIKLWRCKNRSIMINKHHLCMIKELQLIDNNQNLLSLDDRLLLLQKCKIDLIKRDLIKIQEFSDPNNIQSFCQVNNGQNLLLICGIYFKILNNQGESIHQQNHEAGYSQTMINQITQDKSIYILGVIYFLKIVKIILAIAKDKMKYYKQKIQITNQNSDEVQQTLGIYLSIIFYFSKDP